MNYRSHYIEEDVLKYSIFTYILLMLMFVLLMIGLVFNLKLFGNLGIFSVILCSLGILFTCRCAFLVYKRYKEVFK